MTTAHLQIMIHDDWELYGDGQGDVDKVMIEPTRRMLEVCNNVGAKYTFFAEFGQQLAMKNSSLPQHQKWAEAWETHLQEAVRRGHDVQLHFHPQWIGAVYQNGTWTLDYSKWALPRLSQVEMKTWLQKGRDYLFKLFSKVAADYQVTAFRGGGFMIQPSRDVVAVLKEIGIKADVTVIKGLKMKNEKFGSVDFTNAPSVVEPWIPAAEDMASVGSSYGGLFCLPTYSIVLRVPLPIYSMGIHAGSILFERQKRRLEKSKRYSSPYKMTMEPSAGGFFKSRPITADYSSVHYATILRMVENAAMEAERKDLSEIPFVLYSHAKNFFDLDNFRRLLEGLQKDKRVNFYTTRDVVKMWEKKFKGSPN